MMDEINSLDIKGVVKLEKILPLFKTNSSNSNRIINEKIKTFQKTYDFLNNFTNVKTKHLLNIIDKEYSYLSGKNCFNSKYDSKIDEYISCLVHIILSIKLLITTQEIINNILISSKNNLLKLKQENQIKNTNQENLITIIDNILTNLNKSEKLNNPILLSNKRISSIKHVPKIIFTKLSDKKIKPPIEREPTPKFKHLRDESDSTITQKQNSSKIIRHINNSSILTFSELLVDETPDKHANDKVDSNVITINKISSHKNKNFKKLTLFKIENGIKKNLFTERNNKTDIYRNLLEMIQSLYKKGIINAEEKINLKKKVIEKPENLEIFYYNFYKNKKNDYKVLSNEIKKILG